MDFHVLMFGPRRCGKSSALSAMIDQFEEITKNSSSDILIEPEASTKLLLESKQQQLKRIFDTHTIQGENWVIDENPSDASYDYIFNIEIKSSKNSYRVIFTDIPGEWLMEEARSKELDAQLDKSQVIMIAIDTPHLVEEEGVYSRSFNITEQVMNFILKMDAKKGQPRLMLFVPLKCEKYYHEKRMGEVNEQIKKQYEILLNTMRNDNIKQAAYTIAITPILTLGGVVFEDFKRDEEGYVDRFNTMEYSRSLYKRPKAAYYKLYEEAPYYAPAFCEQPVLYLLNYIAKNADALKQAQEIKKEKKKEKKFMRRMLETAIVFAFAPIIIASFLNTAAWFILGKLIKDYYFMNSVKKTYLCLKTSGDGYEIIQDPLKLGE